VDILFNKSYFLKTLKLHWKMTTQIIRYIYKLIGKKYPPRLNSITERSFDELVSWLNLPCSGWSHPAGFYQLFLLPPKNRRKASENNNN
jgi:hypothetical protein